MALGMKCRNIEPGFRVFFILLTLGILFNCSSKAMTTSRHSHQRSKLGNFFKNVTRLRDKKSLDSKKDGFFTNTWAVELDDPGEEEVVARIANKHGFTVLGKARVTQLFVVLFSIYISTVQ